MAVHAPRLSRAQRVRPAGASARSPVHRSAPPTGWDLDLMQRQSALGNQVVQRQLLAATTQPNPVDQQYEWFVDKLTELHISDDDVTLMLQDLRELRQIDKRYPLVKSNAFSELVIRLRDREEGNLLKVLLDQLDDDHYEEFSDVIVALMVHLPLFEQVEQAERAAEEIGFYNLDAPQQRLATLMGLLEPERYVATYMDQKVLEIKYYAGQENSLGLQASFRDFYGLYDQLATLLFSDDIPWVLERIWKLFRKGEIIPKIGDPAAETKTADTQQVPKGAKSAPAPPATKNVSAASGAEVTGMITRLAEKAHRHFEDLASFSKKHPIVIEAANLVVGELKKVEEEKLTSKFVVQDSALGSKNRDTDTDALDWIDLVRIWFWEMGPESLQELRFGPDALTTHDVKDLLGTREVVETAMRRVRQGSFEPLTLRVSYGTPEFFNSIKNRNRAFNFLGTYEVTVKPEKPSVGAKTVKLQVEVHDPVWLPSFTRFRAPEKPGGDKRPIIDIDRKRTDPGVKIGATLQLYWKWEEQVPLSLTSPEIKVQVPDVLKLKPPLIPR
jgi:hypothetical protein